MTDKQINLAIGAIMHAELVMDFPDVILDALNSVIAFLATVNEQPERKKGKWILVKGSNGKDYHKCSECLHTQEITGIKNYCAVCGADMRGEQDE